MKIEIRYWENKELGLDGPSKMQVHEISPEQKKELKDSPTNFVKKYSELFPYGKCQFLLTKQLYEFEEGLVRISNVKESIIKTIDGDSKEK